MTLITHFLSRLMAACLKSKKSTTPRKRRSGEVRVDSTRLGTTSSMNDRKNVNLILGGDYCDCRQM